MNINIGKAGWVGWYVGLALSTPGANPADYNVWFYTVIKDSIFIEK